MKKNVTSQRMNTTAGVYPMDYQNNYTYPSTGNPFAIRSVQDALSGSVNNFDWDANGNLIKSSCISGPAYDRRLCWTEDNRLQGYTEYSDENGDMSAWYNYNAGGDRNFKITSPSLNMRQNAVGLRYSAHLKYPTLYASALITFNKGGYTKHYFEGTNRVCSKIGGGFRNVHWDNIEDRIPALAEDYDQLSEGQRESVKRTFIECLNMGVEMDGIIDLYEVIAHETERDDPEPAFFYHSDHLGSAAYLTNDAGQVTQTLNYLPYGEDWVDRQEYHETRYPRLGIFTYNGKEKDYESGFHYYGARYYWSELLTGWLSVDPMADKYPSISPYAYCAWNPIICIDPDGEKIYMLFYTVGNSRGGNMFHAAALTRRSDIMKSKSFDAKNDIVVMRPIQDLASIKDEVQNINIDYGEKYGKTAEFDVWSHGGLDGPTGTQPTSSNALDSKQMKLEGWSEIDFNWDENASANFYGYRTGKSENGKPSFAQAVSELNNFKDVKVSGQSKRAYPSTSKTRRNEPSHYFGKLGLSFTKTYMVGCESSSERLWISPGRDVYPMNTFINGEQQ